MAREKDHNTSEHKRKRRRRNIRTAAISDSSSSSSDSSDDERSVGRNDSVKEVVGEDVEMGDVPADSSDEDGVQEEEEEESLATKSGTIPPPLRDLRDAEAEAKFEEYYMRLITTEFADDLNRLRMANDFGEKSLPVLIRALRQGVNIFDPEEKRIVVGETGGGGGEGTQGK